MKIFEIYGEHLTDFKLSKREYEFEKYLDDASYHMNLFKNFPLVVRKKIYSFYVKNALIKINNFIKKCEDMGVPDMKEDEHVQRAIHIGNELHKIKKPE